MTKAEPEEVPIADIEIDEVRPERSGFVLLGRGSDGVEYRLEMHLDLPVDKRTQTVLAEMLSQSELRLWRRTTAPLRKSAPRTRKPVT